MDKGGRPKDLLPVNFWCIKGGKIPWLNVKSDPIGKIDRMKSHPQNVLNQLYLQMA